MVTYRIKRRSCGDYEIQRRSMWIFWIRDGGERRLKSQDRSIYFYHWYKTYQQAKNGVAARIDFNRTAKEEGGTLPAKVFYQPFPDKDT